MSWAPSQVVSALFAGKLPPAPPARVLCAEPTGLCAVRKLLENFWSWGSSHNVPGPGEIKASPINERRPPRRHRIGPLGPGCAPLAGVNDDGPGECDVSRANVLNVVTTSFYIEVLPRCRRRIRTPTRTRPRILVTVRRQACSRQGSYAAVRRASRRRGDTAQVNPRRTTRRHVRMARRPWPLGRRGTSSRLRRRSRGRKQ